MKQHKPETSKIGRPRDYEEDEALNKAMLLFWRHGFETTSMSLLSKNMNMNAPSIYAAFGDKKSLFLKALDLYVGKLSEIESFLDNAPSAFEATYEILKQSAIRFTGKETPTGCMLASAVASCSAESADVQITTAKIRAKIESLIKQRIEKDIKNQILPKSFSAEAFAALATATIQGMSVLARDGASRKKVLLIAETSMLSWNHG
ncbi:MAG: TetR/AcrR family transcriptional regulator [Bdellovibrio sp.]|nr:TetR/AcrR family transcriptional regulator [Bdellovibrio sp.]